MAPEATNAKSHPLAYSVMRLLTHRDEADLRFVFAALAQRVRPENDGRRESAVVALERCATDLGVPEPPTSRGYADWRGSSDAHRGAPSVKQIRTAFDGSWTRAVEAMPRVPGSDPLVRRLTARGAKFTKAECVDALKRWHMETGSNTTGAYTVWARGLRQADPHARHLRPDPRPVRLMGRRAPRGRHRADPRRASARPAATRPQHHARRGGRRCAHGARGARGAVLHAAP